MDCSTKAGFWIQSAMSILLGRGLKKEGSAFFAENGKNTWMAFFIDNYEFSLKV